MEGVLSMQGHVFSSPLVKFGAVLAIFAGISTGIFILREKSTNSDPTVSPNSAKTVQLAEPQDQIIHVGNGAEPKELDPATVVGMPEARIIENLFEGLTTLHPLTLQPQAGVAESWEVSNNGTTYTFKLRKDAKWSDGTEVTAHDFVFSWQRVVSPTTASEYAYQLYYLKNGEEINKGTIKDLNSLGVTAKDDYTLEVRLNHPVPYFLYLTAFQTYFPTPQQAIRKFPEREWTKEGNMVSNGPFKLSEWRLNKHIKLEPNPYYWDKEAVHLKAAYIYPIENIDTEEKSFWAGELDMTQQVPMLKISSYLDEAKKDPTAYHPYKVAPFLSTYFYRLNTTKAPFNDKRVRRALAITLDRQLLIDKVTRRHELPADSLCPPGLLGYDFPGTLKPSVNKEIIAEAKELLKQAGYPDGKGFPSVTLLYNTSEGHKKIALAFRQMWKDTLGIDINLFNQEWKVYLDTQRKMQFDISRAGWVGDYPDPNTFLDMMVSEGSNNQTGWANKEYDRLIEQAALTTDTKDRLEFFRQAEAILMDEMPIIPVYVYTSAKLVGERVKISLPHEPLRSWQGNLSDRLFLKYYALTQ
jgi:oligopeptide transport system substrate-binding protein